MFKTLRAKLVLSYIAVAMLCLLIATVIALAFGRDVAQRSGLQNLRQKEQIVLPLLRIVYADLRRPRPRPLETMVWDSINKSGLRLLELDAKTLEVVRDTSLTADARGERVILDGSDEDVSRQLDGGGVVGRVRFEGENTWFQYVAHRLRTTPFSGANRGQSGVQGEAAPDATTLIVVMQRERGIESIARDFAEYALIAVAAALLLSLAAAYGLARSLSRPVAQLATAAKAMAEGDYEQRVPVSGRDEIASLTRQFNEMAEEVDRAHRMQRDFVANTSHDLKTPLTSIQGFSQAMLDGTIRDDAGYKQAALIINEEAGRMARMVGQLFALTELQSNLHSLERTPVQLSALLSQLVLAHQPQAQQAGVMLLFNESQPPAWVLADADRLKQAIGNLIDNSVKHSRAGGTIRVAVRLEAARARVTVSDTGEGILPEDLPRVMERFYQTDKARTAGRTSAGLGLSIAREIVVAHGGTIAIASEPGRGATVSIELPAVAASAARGRDRRFGRGSERLDRGPANTDVPGGAASITGDPDKYEPVGKL